MSRSLSESDWREPFQMNDVVTFDSPYGGRLTGEIARIYNGNPCAFHVEVDGTRYEVDLHQDNLRMGSE